MSSIQALSVVLGEKRNARIANLETDKAELKKQIGNLEQKMQHLMGCQEVVNCICDHCKTDIYLSAKSEPVQQIMRTLGIIGWNNTYLVMSRGSLLYYGRCPRCTTESIQNISNPHILS
jgi:hypothetical protein